MKKCQNCNLENDDTAKFCKQCGTEFPNFINDEQVRCNACGEILFSGMKHCPNCGALIDEISESGGQQVQNDFKPEKETGLTSVPSGKKVQSAPNNKLVYFILGLLIILIAFNAFIIVNMRKTDADKNQSAENYVVQTSENKAQENKEDVLKEQKQNTSSDSFDDLDVEAEVAQIRSWYYWPTDQVEKITIEKGTDGWDYSREYYYYDGKLFFAFVYDGTEEHRLYFKDDIMIRYVDEYDHVFNYGNIEQFSEWEERVITEAYQ